MADKRPLAHYTGAIKEIATGDTVPLANGGTGATTAAAARTTLGAAPGTLSTPGSDHTAEGVNTAAINAGESITIMDLVYLKSDGKWWKTDADAASTTDGLLGISLQTQTANNAMSTALPGSFVRDDTWNWTPGATLYADTTTAGGLTATQPSGTDDAIRVIGWAITADVIYFAPSGLYFTHT